MALVCLCHGVSDRTVREVVADGADSIDAIGACCDAGLSCGTCHSTLAGLLAKSSDTSNTTCAA